MTVHGHVDPAVEPISDSAAPSTSESMRSTLLRLDQEDVARQLPGLLDTIVTESEQSDDTITFIVGVSFSTNESLLDYSLERLVHRGPSEEPELETLKPAVNSEHLYLTFYYPPDPDFDGSALRGVLLSVIEQQHVDARHSRRQSGSDGALRGSRERRFISRLWGSLFSG